MIVMKFGGTSLAGRKEVQQVAKIVSRQQDPTVVVVSAMGRTTDVLLEVAALAERGETDEMRLRLDALENAHREAVDDRKVKKQIETLFVELRSVLEGVRLLREQTPRSRALVCSFGERLAAPVVASHIGAASRRTEPVDARTFIITDGSHESAHVDFEGTRVATRARLFPLMAQGVTPVITGFLGSTRAGITTTLGRGGSDDTAALLGNLLSAEEIWIWTDVDGILTADPRLVKEARTLEQVSYREAAEMSYFGAKVLHPKTISPAVSARIPIRIKNTFRPKAPGTVIAETSPRLPQGVKTVSSIHDLALVTIEGRGMAGVPGVARRVFEATERAEVNVIMISQGSSEQNITFVVPAADTERLVSELEEVFALELKAGAVDRIVTHRDVAVVSIVGRGMAGTPGVSARLFGAMGGVQVNVLAIAQGSSELSISVAVKEDQARRAVRAVHSAFGLTRIVNLMVLGCGRVGETLLAQLAETHGAMETELGLELRLVGLANSRRLLLDDGGIDPKKAVAKLDRGSPRPPDHELIKRLLEARFTDLVLVDVTAADTGALQLRALESGIHVVSANKRPLAGTLAQFESLVAAARSTGAKLAYETTFGAGLPVLHTLKELRDTGDRFLEISGCFSGTLGFLCTRLEEGASLERAVEAARNLGLTEPDPREDLSGRDVARKALIIARSAGIAIEPDAVSLTPLIKNLEKGLDQALKSQGDAVGRLAKSASDQGKVLRYVATITPEEVKVGLRAVPKTDPIGSLHGQDNMLVYRTRRYNEHPLVIRGPGAGAEVTAAGVLGDVLKVARG